MGVSKADKLCATEFYKYRHKILDYHLVMLRYQKENILSLASEARFALHTGDGEDVINFGYEPRYISSQKTFFAKGIF